jgi:hypothetical protein
VRLHVSRWSQHVARKREGPLDVTVPCPPCSQLSHGGENRTTPWYDPEVGLRNDPATVVSALVKLVCSFFNNATDLEVRASFPSGRLGRRIAADASHISTVRIETLNKSLRHTADLLCEAPAITLDEHR